MLAGRYANARFGAGVTLRSSPISTLIASFQLRMKSVSRYRRAGGKSAKECSIAGRGELLLLV
jgi:hypothetical protein